MKGKSTDYITLPRLGLALVALLILGASCTHRETGDDLLQPYELRYKASFRSAAPTWQKNDQMGVFSLSHGVVSDDNILYTSSAGDGVFFSTSPIHRSPSSPLEIIAYYPYTTEASQGQIPMNYASQAQGKAPDYFYGKLSDVTWTPEPKVTLSRINALLQLVVTASLALIWCRTNFSIGVQRVHLTWRYEVIGLKPWLQPWWYPASTMVIWS